MKKKNEKYDYIWISGVLLSAPIVPFKNDVGLKNRTRAAECYRITIDEGRPTPDDCVIREAYADEKAGFVQKLPHTFSLNGRIVVSKKVLDVIDKFNIGDTEIFPVKMLQKDKKTPVKGEYFIINPFRNRERIFVPEQSSSKVLKGPQKGIYGDFWSLPFMPKDGEIAVSPDAHDIDVDIWVDPQIPDMLFLSAPLGNALKHKGVSRGWTLRKAKIIVNT